MANYDKPAFVWNQASKSLLTSDIPLQRDELDIVRINPQSQLPLFRNAMDLAGGATVTQNQWGMPITG